MDEVIDHLIDLENGFKEGSLDCMDPGIVMQNNVSIRQVHLFSVLTCYNNLCTIERKNSGELYLRWFLIDIKLSIIFLYSNIQVAS